MATVVRAAAAGMAAALVLAAPAVAGSEVGLAPEGGSPVTIPTPMPAPAPDQPPPPASPTPPPDAEVPAPTAGPTPSAGDPGATDGLGTGEPAPSAEPPSPEPVPDGADSWFAWPTTSTVAAPGTATYGTPFEVVVSVTGPPVWWRGAPTGSVVLYRAGPGSAPERVATLTLGPGSGRTAVATHVEHDRLPAGRHTYLARYEGGGASGCWCPLSSAPSWAPPAAVVVDAASTVVSLSATSASGFEGRPVVLHASVGRADAGPPQPAGEVRFARGDDELATVALVDGEASFVVPAPPAGELAFSATYLGEPGAHAGAGPSSTTLLVAPAPSPGIAVASTPADGSTVDEGDEVLLEATLTSPIVGEDVLAGAVRWYEDGEAIGDVAVGDPLGHRPEAGVHVYTARYLGLAGTWAPSAESAPTRLTVASVPPPRLASTVHLQVGTEVEGGQVVVVMEAGVSGGEDAPEPTGDVVYRDLSTAAGAGPTAVGPLPATTTTLPIGTPLRAVLSPGPHTFVADYLGDATYLPVSSDPVSFTVPLPPVPPSPPPPSPPAGPTEPPVPASLQPAPVASATPATSGASSVLPLAVAAPALVESAAPPSDEVAAGRAPAPEGEVATGAPGEVASRPTVTRSELVEAVPAPDSVSWSAGHVASSSLLALLLIMLLAFPAELVNSTLVDHYEEIERPFARGRSRLLAFEARLLAVPNGVLLVGFAAVGALIAGLVDPSFGFDASSLVLFLGLTAAFVVITSLLELARIPFLDRRAGRRRGHHLRLFPLVLVLAAVFTLVSRVADFRPGYIVGVTCGLLLAEDVSEDEDARSLALAGLFLLVASVAAWLAWVPWQHAADAPAPGLLVVFADTFLATLFVSCLQALLFGFAPLHSLYGKVVQRWSFVAWAALYGAAAFLFVQLVLHPSAGRWGGVPDTSLGQVLSLFLVLLAGALLFWGWFRVFSGRPAAAAGDQREGSGGEGAVDELAAGR